MSLKIKEFTFDRSVIKRRWKASNRQPLKKAGAFVRKEARQSIKRRKRGSQSKAKKKKPEKPSKPGSPPYSRSSSHPLKMIFFIVNSNKTNVVIGPVGFKKAGGKTQPELHEKGGRTRIKVRAKDKKKARGFLAQVAQKIKMKFKSASYPKRPFMLPAYKRAKKNLAKHWKDSIKKK